MSRPGLPRGELSHMPQELSQPTTMLAERTIRLMFESGDAELRRNVGQITIALVELEIRVRTLAEVLGIAYIPPRLER